jgi:hypothetical protein
MTLVRFGSNIYRWEPKSSSPKIKKKGIHRLPPGQEETILQMSN